MTVSPSESEIARAKAFFGPGAIRLKENFLGPNGPTKETLERLGIFEETEARKTDPYTFTSKVKSVEQGKNFPEDAPYTIHLENGVSIRLGWDGEKDSTFAKGEGVWVMTCPYESFSTGKPHTNEQVRHMVIVNPMSPQPLMCGLGINLIDLPEEA